MRHMPFSAILGFSLLELLLVLALFSLMVSTITPVMAEQITHRQQWSGLYQLYRHLKLARLSAIDHQTTVSVCPSASGQRCDAHNQWQYGWMVFFDPDHSGQPRDLDDIIEIGTALEQAELTSGGRARIRFQADGTAYGSNGTFTLCPLAYSLPQRQIVISNPGRIRAQPAKKGAHCQKL